MSAWSVGKSTRGPVRALDGTGQPQLKTFVDRVVQWIPGDVLGLYVAGVTALGLSAPKFWFLIIAILLAPVLVVLGNLQVLPAERQNKVPLRAVLSAVATAIWTLTVPGSGWGEFDFIADNARIVSVIAAIAGLVFGLAASAAVGQQD